MPVIPLSEYTAEYFDGKDQTYTHNAGYSHYRRWHRFMPKTFPESADENGDPAYSDPNDFTDISLALTGRFNVNTTFLELGAAKGYITHDLILAGIDAYAVDVSEYAINIARQELVDAGYSTSEAEQRFIHSDALTYLQTLKNNSFNTLFSRWFLCCFTDDDLNGVGVDSLIDEMNRVGQNQVHVVMTKGAAPYNIKTAEQWAADHSWDRNTWIVPDNDLTIAGAVRP